jgi:peptidoglycan L-alanyl-D-glutamate endopeptidase CwlK
MQTYTVKAGDSLWRIASLIYHDGDRWQLIADANRIRDPSRLAIGQRLVLPNGNSAPPAAPVAPTAPQTSVPASNDLLSRVAPTLATKGRNLIQGCREAGVTIRVSQSLRTWAEQDALYARGRTAPGEIRTNARAGESFHNFGMAFDIELLDCGRVTWDSRHPGWRIAGEIGSGLGLLWGGHWKTIKDLPHFEIRGRLTLQECRALYPSGLDAIWARLM